MEACDFGTGTVAIYNFQQDQTIVLRRVSITFHRHALIVIG
jgi:hypothetical protein